MKTTIYDQVRKIMGNRNGLRRGVAMLMLFTYLFTGVLGPMQALAATENAAGNVTEEKEGSGGYDEVASENEQVDEDDFDDFVTLPVATPAVPVMPAPVEPEPTVPVATPAVPFAAVNSEYEPGKIYVKNSDGDYEDSEGSVVVNVGETIELLTVVENPELVENTDDKVKDGYGGTGFWHESTPGPEGIHTEWEKKDNLWIGTATYKVERSILIKFSYKADGGAYVPEFAKINITAQLIDKVGKIYIKDASGEYIENTSTLVSPYNVFVGEEFTLAAIIDKPDMNGNRPDEQASDLWSMDALNKGGYNFTIFTTWEQLDNDLWQVTAKCRAINAVRSANNN